MHQSMDQPAPHAGCSCGSDQAGINQQREFTRDLVTGECLESCFTVFDGKTALKLRLQTPFGEQRPDLLLQITQEVGLELIVAIAQGRADQLNALAQHLGQVQGGLASAHQTNIDPTTITGQQFQVERRVLPANRIEDHIERSEITQRLQVFAAQGTALGTERFAVGQSLGRADADPARTAECLAQLDGSRTDATGASMQQDFSPGRRAPSWNRLSQAVAYTSGTTAASTRVKPSGTGMA